MPVLSLSELRRVAERTKLVSKQVDKLTSKQVDKLTSKQVDKLTSKQVDTSHPTRQLVNSSARQLDRQLVQVTERVPWRVWYVSASNGDCILGEECITLAVYTDGPGQYPSRLVQFTASGQTRRLRDCCILRADNFTLRI